MIEKSKLVKAQKMYQTLCDILNDGKVRFEKDDQNLTINFTMTGEDLPMKFFIIINAESELINIFSPIPAKFSSEKLLDGAVAVCQANYTTTYGCFEYDLSNGTILFKMNSSYKDSLISSTVFYALIMVANMCVDKFNDKFLLLAKGLITLETFFQNT